MSPEKSIHQFINNLAHFSDRESGLTRTFCSPSAKKLNEYILAKAQKDGLQGFVDPIANIRIRSLHYNPKKPTFFIGSHLDSVINAGKYDGPLGFAMGYEILKTLNHEKLPINIEILGFSDEEGEIGRAHV